MAIDISLIAVPKEAERILKKATLAQDSEYPDAVFGFLMLWKINLPILVIPIGLH